MTIFWSAPTKQNNVSLSEGKMTRCLLEKYMAWTYIRWVRCPQDARLILGGSKPPDPPLGGWICVVNLGPLLKQSWARDPYVDGEASTLTWTQGTPWYTSADDTPGSMVSIGPPASGRPDCHRPGCTIDRPKCTMEGHHLPGCLARSHYVPGVWRRKKPDWD